MDEFQFTIVLNVGANNAKDAKAFVYDLVEGGRALTENAARAKDKPAQINNWHVGRLTDVMEWIPVRSVPVV